MALDGWTSSGIFTSSSAYRAMFIGQYSIEGARELRKTRALPKAKFFIWLVLLSYCWTNDRLQRHGMPNDGPCSLCSQSTETADHLLLGCAYSREIWFKLLRHSMNQRLTPTASQPLPVWWIHSRKSLPKPLRKRFDSFVVLVCWELWKERNRRIFQRQNMQPPQLLRRIRDGAADWIHAGYRSLGSLF